MKYAIADVVHIQLMLKPSCRCNALAAERFSVVGANRQPKDVQDSRLLSFGTASVIESWFDINGKDLSPIGSVHQLARNARDPKWEKQRECIENPCRRRALGRKQALAKEG